ncbi:MAG: hypothetical protein ABSD73_05330 [Candidatus Bathyarchaeia archaeon]|jgi:hypothetical protein
MTPKNLKSKGFHWVFMSMLIISAILYSASTFPKCSASSSSPTVLVDPPQTILTGATVGTLFNVSVSIANITAFMGPQFTLTWNTTFLTCTKMTEILFHNVTPSDQWSNIWSINLKINNTAGTATYAQTFQDTGSAISGGYAPINVTTANYGNGETALATLTFNVTAIPPTNMKYQTGLAISGVVVGDVNGLPITMATADGQIVIYGPPESVTSVVVKSGTNYNVITVSNATVVPSSMTYIANWTLNFNLTAASNGGTTAYVNVTIPKNLVALANEAADHWNVTVNGTPVTPIVAEDSTNTYLYFTTGLSTKTVQIVGTIPEFPVLMAIPLLMIATLIAVGLRKRRQT